MSKCTLTRFLASLSVIAMPAVAADYPPNIDYGSEGDFITKRAVEYGRAANILPIGPILVGMPEAPGSTSNAGVVADPKHNFWDISDLTNPVFIRDGDKDMPIHAHATVWRFDEEEGPLLYAGGIKWIRFNENGATSNDQLEQIRWGSWEFSGPLGYSMMFAPYHVRTYWEYGLDTSGDMAIRNPADVLSNEELDELRDMLGQSQSRTYYGRPFNHWNHMAQASVTGFTAWLGNLLVTGSDQQMTGMSVYDVSGYKLGQPPKLLSKFNPSLTEPNGDIVGVGGYWVEPYGTTKMVWAARSRENSNPARKYPALYVVDFTDPSQPELTCEVYFNEDPDNPADGDQSTNPMYVNFQDEYAYVDHMRVNIPLCEAAYADDKHIDSNEMAEIAYKFDDIANECEGSQYFRPLGQVGVFGGYDYWRTKDVNEQGMCFFVTSDEPDTRPPFVAGHRPLAGQTNYPVDGFIHIHIPETLRTESVMNAVTLVNTSTNEPVPFRLQLTHTGTLALWPRSDLADNSSFTVSLSGIQDFMGNTMDDYAFSFSTGATVTGPNPETPVPTPPLNPTPEPTPVATPDIPSYAGVPFYPVKSSQLACEPESFNGHVWAVNPDNDSVTLLERRHNNQTYALEVNFLKEIKLGYEHPTSVSKFGEVFAVTYRDDDKVVFHNAQGFPVQAVDTGHGTQPVSSLTDGDYLYVALYGSGEVVKISSDGTIAARLKVGPKPKAMALHGNRLLVARFISTMQNGSVYDINTNGEMALSRTIVVNKLLVPDDIDHGGGIPNYLSSMVITADGTRAYITANKVNMDRGLQRNGLPLDDDNTVRPIIVTLDLVNHRDINTDPTNHSGTIDLDNGAEPNGVIFLADPNIRAHTLRGNNVVVVQNLALNRSAQFTTGLAPQDMCTTLRGLFVKNYTGRSVTAIDVAKFMHDGSMGPNIINVPTVQNEVLTAEELKGLQLFHDALQPEMGPEGYMSCASCHNEGGQDGMVWDLSNLGEGFRNTLPLNGTNGTRFGVLHWSGNFDEVQDFELQIEHLNGGEGLIAGETFTVQSPLEMHTSGVSADLDALAAYVANLGKASLKRSPYRSYTGGLSAAAMRGEKVFAREGCASCHAGSAFRDGLTHDVGTIKATTGARLGGEILGIRTPNLVQLWESAPYFHDGSAQTLEDVLRTGAHDTGLNNADRDDLIQYLLSIDRDDYINDDELFVPMSF